jgi:hypothetical protein
VIGLSEFGRDVRFTRITLGLPYFVPHYLRYAIGTNR